MPTLQNRLGKIEFLIAALAVTAVAGCGTSQNQAPPAAATIAPAPEATPPTAQEARSKSSAHKPRSKSAAMRARMSPEVSTKLNTAMVLSQLHQANLMEIELAKIAQEKGSIDGVRAYANQLVQDHTSLDQMVIAMAQKSGNLAAVGRSAHESAQEKTLEKKLKSANGARFDKLFLQQASADHESLIRKLQQDREDASDDELEALIDKTLPILEQHKELAQILMNKEQASGQANRTHS
jgi:predicted outer membrane protein